MAGPLRHLVAVLTKIRCDAFRPDQTRSGYLAYHHGRGRTATTSPPSSTCSSRSSSSPASATDTKIDATIEPIGDIIPEFVRNKRTLYVHRLTDLNTLVCPKAFPVSYEYLDACPPEGPRCSRCF